MIYILERFDLLIILTLSFFEIICINYQIVRFYKIINIEHFVKLTSKISNYPNLI